MNNQKTSSTEGPSSVVTMTMSWTSSQVMDSTAPRPGYLRMARSGHDGTERDADQLVARIAAQSFSASQSKITLVPVTGP
jgi:hypothetical protein